MVMLTGCNLSRLVAAKADRRGDTFVITLTAVMFTPVLCVIAALWLTRQLWEPYFCGRTKCESHASTTLVRSLHGHSPVSAMLGVTHASLVGPGQAIAPKTSANPAGPGA